MISPIIELVRTRLVGKQIDWSAEPWASAMAPLAWLGLAPEPTEPRTRGRLTGPEIEALASAMAGELISAGGVRPWSSYRLVSALDSMSLASGGEPPEPLLKALWHVMERQELDEKVYEFSREFGRQLLGKYRHDRRWNLDWVTSPRSSAQACFLYWTIGVKPERYTEDLESAVTRMTSSSTFEF